MIVTVYCTTQNMGFVLILYVTETLYIWISELKVTPCDNVCSIRVISQEKVCR